MHAWPALSTSMHLTSWDTLVSRLLKLTIPLSLSQVSVHMAKSAAHSRAHVTLRLHGNGEL